MIEDFSISTVGENDKINNIKLELTVIYAKTGSCVIYLENSPISLSLGQVAVVYPYTLFRIEKIENAECFLMTFPYTLSKEFYSIPTNTTPRGFAFSLASETAKYVELLLSDDCRSEHKAKSLYYAIMNEFYMNNNGNFINNDFLHKMIDLIRSDSIENITIKEVSYRLGVSKVFLLSFLKNHIGINFKDFVNNVLVGKSIELLYNKELSITDVATKSGFGSLRSFNRVFICKMGCTPSQYRKRIYS